MYTSNLTLYKSDLMNSYAWDTAIYFIQQCGTASNHSTYSRAIGKSTTSAEANTGINLLNTTNSVDVQCNIYDIAGNVDEWTTEYSSLSTYIECPYTYRGGFSEVDAFCAASRCAGNAYSSGRDNGFRHLLYLIQD